MPADVPTTGPNLRSPGERPPVEPILATQHSAAGAKAFAEFFVRTIDWGFATMSGAYIRHYAAASCLGCEQFADGIDRARAAHHTYVGGWFTITGSSARNYTASAASIAVRYDSLSFEEVDQQGKGVSADPARTNQTFVVDLAWTPSGWRTQALAVQT